MSIKKLTGFILLRKCLWMVCSSSSSSPSPGGRPSRHLAGKQKLSYLRKFKPCFHPDSQNTLYKFMILTDPIRNFRRIPGFFHDYAQWVMWVMWIAFAKNHFFMIEVLELTYSYSVTYCSQSKLPFFDTYLLRPSNFK